MRRVLRRFLMFSALGVAATAIMAAAATARTSDRPGHVPSPGYTAAAHGNTSAKDAGSGDTSSSPAAAPDSPAASTGGEDATPAPAASDSAVPASDGDAASAASHDHASSPTDASGPGNPAAHQDGGATGSAGRSPGSGAFDLSHLSSSFSKRIERFALQGRTTTGGSLAQVASCGYGPNTQEFLSWGDSATYNLAPQGDLSSSDGWSLTAATVSAEHDPYSAAVASVSLTSNKSQAVTPAMCVDLTNPTMRFFVSHTGPQSNAAVDVDVVYTGLDGQTHRLALASVQAGSAWQPSPVIPIVVNALSTVSVSGWTPVAFEFSVHGLQPGESYSVDGVYVDPCWSR